ncbi:Putative uncharacterized protein [Taphrina deformans PYCC 5710]|uniref:Ino eighty subunit 1 n=1 Tax=Taphrina deformans (strain PYCC 5710 / ATCC 11124 / CBS 356.35 / IMI 108563 / JCM 9778 / NBRC 8474) TaxID=1097556 RepID=R4XPS6_TAPDE|nr:Putative uncharacterized protein [Taphrina deformans PYCC 5710]|eukprot:CCG85181.1 Putative uncharacterized protein [Taphrina deformans PYCC 5710]
MPPAASLATSLKRGEGDPLNRHDIQYALLEKIFEDDHAVFTPRPGSVYDTPGNRITFGDLYVEDLLASNKLSKTLKDKFLNDMDVTRKVCMASVLVNTGRINTTLVFTPTQARTYNPIPAIQAYGTGHKMLQDAPRLKGILKGSCDKGPVDWISLREAQRAKLPKPLTSPITLIFLLTHVATVMDIQHFSDPNFLPHELLSDYHYTSDSRARAFLWLMYFYIETNGTLEETASNPFGSGPGNFRVPTLSPATEADSFAENIDLPREKEYSTRMCEERKRYLALSAQKASETPRMAKITNGGTDQGSAARASSVTPSVLEDSVRRSSRKIKRKTYDSGHDSEEAGAAERDDYRSQRAQQILRHKLRRSQHRSKKVRKSQNIFLRALNLEAEDDRFVYDDSDGEEAMTLAKVMRRAQRRTDRYTTGKRPGADKERRGDGDAGTAAAAARKASGGFKIKLKF